MQSPRSFNQLSNDGQKQLYHVSNQHLQIISPSQFNFSNNKNIILKSDNNISNGNIIIIRENCQNYLYLRNQNDCCCRCYQNNVLSQNEDDCYCKYCQFGTCNRQYDEKYIHVKLSDDDKDKFIKCWSPRLAILYNESYIQASSDMKTNKYVINSKTRSKFTYLKDKHYGLLSIVVDIIFKGKSLILNPPLIYILEDENTNEIYHATWCKSCMGAKNNLCPSYSDLNEYFEPSFKYHDSGAQMCLAVTETPNGLEIHSPLEFTMNTHDIKNAATPNFAKEYIDNCKNLSSEDNVDQIPLAKSFPAEIINIHTNITKPTIRKIYNGKINSLVI